MNKKRIIGAVLTSFVLALGMVIISNPQKHKAEITFATYTNGDADTYYQGISDSKSGNDLLKDLRSLNLSKRQSTVGYSSMGTSPSGQFKYTDYDPATVQYDSNGQPYGTKISSFYTYTSATSWNREHVWPNSHGGGSGGDTGSPYPDADIHMPRPTISSENSSRGNSFFVEGMNHSSNGWDPLTAGYSAESRGEAARITFYCTLVNSKLILCANNTTPSGTDPITGQSFGSGHTMGNLETLLKWTINYPVTQRERNRNEGAEYLQGNRNPFVDHPEYACRIWGSFNSTTQNLCNNASWDIGNSVSISQSSISLTVEDVANLTATASDGSAITWSSSDNTVAEVSNSGQVTATGPGTCTITASATIEGNAYTATCSVTVSSGGGGDVPGPTEGEYTIVPSDLDGSYPTSVKTYTSSDGLSFSAKQVMNQQSKVQFKKNEGTLYNNNELNLLSINFSNLANGTPIVYGGNSKNPTSNTITPTNGVYNLSGYKYFTIKASSPYFTCSSITVALGGEDEDKTLSSISIEDQVTEFELGEEFVKPTVIAHYSDNSTADVTSSATCTGYNMSSAGNYTVTVSYTEDEVTKQTTYSIRVVEEVITLDSISVATAPSKTTYTVGEYFDPTGLIINRHYSNGSSDTYSYAGHSYEFTFTPSTSTELTTSNTSVTITYGGMSTTQAITVTAPKTLSSITVSTAPTKTTYTAGEHFDPAGLVITRTYSDSTSDTYTYSGHTSEFSFSPSTSTSLTTSNTSVTITYNNKTCSQSITVNPVPKTLSKIEVANAKTSFGVGDEFSFDGIVTATFSDNSTANVTSEASFSGYDMSTSGSQTVTVSYTYQGHTESTTYPIMVYSGGGETSQSQRISISKSSTYYQTGDICPTGTSSSGSASCDAFDVSWLKNSGTSNISYTYAEIRIYGSHSFTITPKEGYEIENIVITANNSSYANAIGGKALTNCTKDVSDSTVTLSPTDGSSAVGFTQSAQSRVNYIVVNYISTSSGGTDVTLSSIEVSGQKTVYMLDESFVKPTVTATYSDNSTSNVTSEATFSGFDSSMPTDSQTIAVSYTYGSVTKTTSYTISIVASGGGSTGEIEAYVTKTFYVGETISHDDITVVDADSGDETYNFIFNGGVDYQFKYEDAASGGALTTKKFANGIYYEGMFCDLEVQVQRKAKVDAGFSKDISYTDLPTSYQTSTTERTAASGLKFIAYNCANYSSKMQFKSSGGYLQTTQPLDLSTVVINNPTGASLTVYGSTDGYSFSSTISGNNNVYNLTGYSYVKIMKNGSNAGYCGSVTINVGEIENAKNIANYIMYEDTNNQCVSKLGMAIGYLSNLSASELQTFQTSNDYVIATARTRLEAWATNQGKTINYNTGDVTANTKFGDVDEFGEDNNAMLVIIAAIASVSALTILLVIKKKRKYK